MKNTRDIIIALALIFGAIFTVNAQAPYKNSIGVTVGNFQAFSYKTFVTNHFAVQLDLGTKITRGADENWAADIWTFEFNPNFMYEGHFTKGLYGFIGGGVSLGYNWGYYHDVYFFGFHWGGRTGDNGKFGANGILGLEYKFSAPVTMQLDFRPGYGLLFNDNDWHWSYFDWSVNLGVRYAF